MSHRPPYSEEEGQGHQGAGPRHRRRGAASHSSNQWASAWVGVLWGVERAGSWGGRRPKLHPWHQHGRSSSSSRIPPLFLRQRPPPLPISSGAHHPVTQPWVRPWGASAAAERTSPSYCNNNSSRGDPLSPPTTPPPSLPVLSCRRGGLRLHRRRQPLSCNSRNNSCNNSRNSPPL